MCTQPVTRGCSRVATVRSSRPKAKVYVPRSAGAILQAGVLMPESVQRLLGRLFRTDSVMREYDPDARRTYHDRIGKD